MLLTLPEAPMHPISRALLLLSALSSLLSSFPGLAQPANPRPEPRLDWWREARFGMFIHWGIYSVPAGEWKGKTVPGASEWIMHTAQISIAEYEPLAPQFNPKHFDASKIVGLAREAGMKYLVITSKHHDGFCMWDAKETDWDVFGASPFHRDVMREMSDECRKQGIRFGVYYSIMDWHHPDAKGANFPKYVEYLRGQVTELIQNYNPDILWFDGEWIEEWTPALGADLYQLCRELKPEIIVNNRVGKGRVGMSASKSSAGDFGTPEQEVPSRGLPGYDWETCMTMNDSWGYKTADHNWKDSTTVIRTLADIASKGGNFLFNIGPTRDGEVPPESVKGLEEVGKWMKVNGESIYGTGPSPFARLPWGRCTTKPGMLYLHFFTPPAPDDALLAIPGLKNPATRAQALALPNQAIKVSRSQDFVFLDGPSGPWDVADTVIRLDIEGVPDVVTAPLRPAADGTLTLRAEDAILEGPTIQTQTQDGKVDIGFWIDPTAHARWDAELPRPGSYTIELDLACQPNNAGGQAVITAAGPAGKGAELRINIPNTGSWSTFLTVNAGTLTIPTEGPLTIIIAPGEGFTGALMNLREVRLIPAK
jgi:alpha-L-fucosidase